MSETARQATIERLQAAIHRQNRKQGVVNSAAAYTPAEWIANRRRQRLEEPAKNPLETTRLIEALQAQKANLYQAKGRGEIISALQEISHKWLKTMGDEEAQQGQHPTLHCGEDPFIAALKGEAEKAGAPLNFAPFDLEAAAGQPNMIGLSVAGAAASETGTLLLTSGNDNPAPLNFLSAWHIILLAEERIVPAYEMAWRSVLQFHEDGSLKGGQPRAINMISGPSRTADIEQTLTLGAHGPVELHVVIYG